MHQKTIKQATTLFPIWNVRFNVAATNLLAVPVLEALVAGTATAADVFFFFSFEAAEGSNLRGATIAIGLLTGRANSIFQSATVIWR